MNTITNVKQKLLGFIFLFVGAMSLIPAYPVHAIDSQGTFLGNFGLDCLGMILECKHNSIGGPGEQGPAGPTGPVDPQGVKGDTPGVLSGNPIQVPIDIPINICGNTVNVIGLLNPAFGNTCTNTG